MSVVVSFAAEKVLSISGSILTGFIVSLLSAELRLKFDLAASSDSEFSLSFPIGSIFYLKEFICFSVYTSRF